jgi:hypothetical protein
VRRRTVRALNWRTLRSSRRRENRGLASRRDLFVSQIRAAFPAVSILGAIAIVVSSVVVAGAVVSGCRSLPPGKRVQRTRHQRAYLFS